MLRPVLLLVTVAVLGAAPASGCLDRFSRKAPAGAAPAAPAPAPSKGAPAASDGR
ncbi:MAG TPA: hypothetical protein VFE78_07330 [Gemmataceae bacterium]|nr:hypothetical protein [Gemmataceae bacterium]